MPTLHWIGKDKVVTHHLDVPFRVLERAYSFDASGQHEQDNASENMIIQGDNLEALKALLPRFEGKIKCIYIDPPYNTGNEGWVYNDNVNDPRIRKWLGEVVGREGEDLSRHDKWLCMMYPRLRLLHKLLADGGVIFISIDDTEQASLRHICDEIFGRTSFAGNISWQRTYSTRNDSKGIVSEVEHILAYSKRPGWQPNKLPRTAEMNALYKNPDNDTTPWASDNPFAPGAATHQGMVYAIQHPYTGEYIYPSSGACWRYQQDVMLSIMQGWCDYELKDLDDAEKRAQICGIQPTDVREGVLGIVLADSLQASRTKAKEVYEQGQWPRFYFTRGGKGGIRRKTYLDSVGGKPPTNLWKYDDVGHTDEAKKQMLALFDGHATFDTPKPTRLIERILQIAGDQETLILDSFAGSGTTAHAVLNLNQQDGGNRRFILIEMMNYAESITAERVRRVIQGYGTGNRAVAGTGGDFSYYTLGQPLLNPDGTLNEQVDLGRIREYVWHTETRSKFPAPDEQAHPDLLGIHEGTAYYFHYARGQVTTLNVAYLSTFRERAAHYVIYADLCALSDEQLVHDGITFKKIPRDIATL